MISNVGQIIRLHGWKYQVFYNIMSILGENHFGFYFTIFWVNYSTQYTLLRSSFLPCFACVHVNSHSCIYLTELITAIIVIIIIIIVIIIIRWDVLVWMRKYRSCIIWYNCAKILAPLYSNEPVFERIKVYIAKKVYM